MKTKIFFILLFGIFILLLWIFINKKGSLNLIKTKIFPIFFFGIFILLFGIFITTCITLFNVRNFHSEKIVDESRTVYIKKTVNGFQLIRNGKPFYIKGAAGDSHFKELADIAGNTIRLYDTINLQSNLDIAKKYGLAVIVDIPIPAYSGKNSYVNEDDNGVLKQKIKVLVKKYKNHTALLMWNLGNELNYPKVHWKDFLRVHLGKKRFVGTFNEFIDIIHYEDTNHPVSTTLWNSDIQQHVTFKIFSPEIDLISYNVFGDVKSVKEQITQISFLFGASPYYISEFGSDGWWWLESKKTSWESPIEQSSAKKAEQIKSRYNLIVNNTGNCLGSLLFFWGNKYECTDTWFSLFKDEYKSEIMIEIEHLWRESNDRPKLIGLDYMLVDGKGALDNLIFTPNELKRSELKLESSNIDSLRIKWEIYPDVWYHGWNEEKYNNKKLKPPTPIECFLSTEKNKATFLTPEKEGPYRIFAYVFDNYGYFASTNTPFYVLNPK